MNEDAKSDSVFPEDNKRQTILVVDDSRAFRGAFCRFARDIGGYQAMGVESAKEAIIRIGKHQFDLILLDIFMPGENGLLFLEKFKEIHPEVQIVVMTGAGYDNQLMQTALDRGAAGYVSKTAGWGNILGAMKSALRRPDEN